MAFPASPTNGQTYSVNGVTYVYDSGSGVWDRQGTSASSNPVASVAGRTGAVTLTAADIGAGTMTGALTMSSAFTASVGGTSNGAITMSGNNGITFGPNSTWSAYLKVGGNGIDGTTAQIAATNGNLHLESLGAAYPIYLNYYRAGGVNVNGTLAVTGAMTATGSLTAYYSDERLKTNIKKIENALDKIDQLSGVLYTQNELAEEFGYNDYSQQVGLLAGQVKVVQPEAVKPAPFDLNKDGTSKSGENYLTVQYEKLIPLIVEGIKELRQELNTIKKQIK